MNFHEEVMLQYKLLSLYISDASMACVAQSNCYVEGLASNEVVMRF